MSEPNTLDVPPPLRILLAEDDENDVRITMRAIRKADIAAVLDVTRDGQETIDRLFAERRLVGQEKGILSRPDIVLLDINLPKVNGLEVLRQIKADKELGMMPVLMLTTSARQEDVNMAYAHGASGFVCKPLRFADFVETLCALGNYWRRVARVPGSNGS